jgi:hypothetical protein
MKTLLYPTPFLYALQRVKTFSAPEVEAIALTSMDSVHLNKVATPYTNFRSGVKYILSMLTTEGNKLLITENPQKFFQKLFDEFKKNEELQTIVGQAKKPDLFNQPFYTIEKFENQHRLIQITISRPKGIRSLFNPLVSRQLNNYKIILQALFAEWLAEKKIPFDILQK